MSKVASTSVNYSENSFDFLSKSYSGLSTINKSNNFQDVLNKNVTTRDDSDSYNNSIENSSSVQKNDSSNNNEDDINKLDELKDKLNDLEKDSKSDSKDNIKEILSELMNLLQKLGLSEKNMNLDGKVNSNELQAGIEKINTNLTSVNDLNSITKELMELLKSDSAKNGLDTDSLKLIEKVLNNLSDKLSSINTSSAATAKNSLKDLMAQISNILDNKQNESGKAIALKDMLNKNYSQENNGNSDGSGNNSGTLETKDASKEDKFLKSLINDNKDNSMDKINLFAARTQTIQNQGVGTVNNLTVNKTTLVSDLIKDVKFMTNNNLNELTVKITPENLGEITIKLTQEDGVMKANLKVNSKDAANLLSQNLTDIKTHLSDQNIKIDEVNIELYQEDTTFFSNQGSNNGLSQEQQRNSSSLRNQTEQGANEDNLIENVQEINDGNINYLA
ncbi:flagellar hook-length control protein FliK [Clostridium sp.]|uniref:flagellar hook-length control protein FliK n=1 Tax=Clostridium sp. TaxID=1506 RepID=UPI00261120F8|nr:flagellar hook-length control protein FliK [Clostridium sp.]